MVFLIALVIVWIISGILTYSSLFAVFQREFPLTAVENYKGDRIAFCIIGLCGPIGLLAALVALAFHGE